jgi:coenzyme F420-reducing hydrogenase delta subunit
MSIIDVVNNFCNQDSELGNRVRLAVSYQDALARSDVTQEEYQELMLDLQRLENIQLSAVELDNQIAFNECIEMLKNLPIK